MPTRGPETISRIERARPVMRLIALVAFASFLLAGCGTIQQDQSFTVADDAPSDADAYTGDGYTLRVHVVDENGTPVQGAAVVFFTIDDGWTGEGAAEAEASSGEGGARASSVAFWSFSFASYEMVAGARTNADGYASADLPPGGSIHVAAGDAEGLTTEVRMNVMKGAGGEDGTIEIALYPQFITYTMDVTMGNHVGTAGIITRPNEAFRLEFSDDTGLDQAYRDRILHMQLDATWTNAMDEGADLFVGIGGESQARWLGDDQQQMVFDGEHTETVTATSSDLDGHRQELAERGYFGYLFTDWASLSFDGLPVQLGIEAELKGSNIQIN